MPKNPKPAPKPVEAEAEFVDMSRLTKAQLASLFGVSLPTINDWRHKGMPVRSRASRAWEFDAADCVAWRRETDKDGKVDPFRRKADVEAKLLELQYQNKAGEVISIEDAIDSVANVFKQFQRVVDGFCNRLERRFSLSPEYVAMLEEALDTVRAESAVEMRKLLDKLKDKEKAA